MARNTVVREPEVVSLSEEFERFSLMFRIQHIVLFTSCILLMITGLQLRFPNTGWAAVFFKLTGGVAASGFMHRIGATGLIGVGVFHMIYITVTRDGRHNFRELIPGLHDIKDVFRNVSYFLGRSKAGAAFGRFSYIEKFDYWAVYWGMVVMITTGLMLWFHDATMSILPKFFIDVAHEAHSDEALLATLAIIIWHFYNVHLNPDHFPMSWTWLTGKISSEKMIHHHPLEYKQIVAERNKSTGGNGREHPSSEAREELK
jgi:cytochrome b subunit of formate dehydrogenase